MNETGKRSNGTHQRTTVHWSVHPVHAAVISSTSLNAQALRRIDSDWLSMTLLDDIVPLCLIVGKDIAYSF